MWGSNAQQWLERQREADSVVMDKLSTEAAEKVRVRGR